ncbi:MAG: polysaccharide export protein [Nitrosomonas sp.]|uniref:polysaccharide biosynthesis/export family protein n=1 Tax=Nitrosomonas sp. TaxID=42353 RepID=UPI002B39CDE8|nr:polysaccharide biosynthesis/export family protein [Nitrosomonas sp.]MEB2332480.1 polysaccharide export protein [Nitrosomonas sp.]
MNTENHFIRIGLLLAGIMLISALSGCATQPDWVSSSGASREQILKKSEPGQIGGIGLVGVNDTLARKLFEAKKLGQFADIFPSSSTNNYIIGPGDVIDVTIWEAPPAMLFGAIVLDPSAGPTTTRGVTFPEQMVTSDSTIAIPFAGRVSVRERTAQEIEREIIVRLYGKANQPQVLVRVIKNNTSNVTIVGEVNNSTLMALTPKGERLLDALAISGGVKQSINRMAVQLSRANMTATMALDSVIRDPKQNILLKPGDVITALYQPQSFSVLGATGKNEEVLFEAQGISLAQALARSGGLADNRADARGVFIFRFEDAKLVDAGHSLTAGADGTVPVVYQVDLRDPASFFVTQNFPVQNRDVIYVANSPEAEFNKFMKLLISVAMPGLTINRMFLLN